VRLPGWNQKVCVINILGLAAVSCRWPFGASIKAKSQDPAGWLAGLVGLPGGYATGVRDCIKDVAQRADGESQEGNDCLEGLRHLARFGLTPQLARPLWDWGPWR
jgi:hypothetical protein